VDVSKISGLRVAILIADPMKLASDALIHFSSATG
jgi:hypothetical protein